ncbi:MAG TPA: hypothetical protein VHG90_05415 [Acidimicrobiales bacterium]|nr:hypothetical protein [Acidimicrobiales bacterium]
MTSLTRRLRAPHLESLFVAALVLFGFRLGVRPIGDNSMFTHMRTGIDMVAGEGIPRVDPYSFTAAGRRWVVQSWLPEWTYGWAHRIGGFELVVLEQALLCALLVLLILRLAKAGSPLRTALAGTVAVGIGAPFWSPRPLLFGLVCMALLVTVVERRRSPWLLVPLVWFWVQSHGSFPLGLGWLGARAVGEWLDWRSRPHDTLRYVSWFAAGLVASVISPLGARLLLFPLTVGEKREAFESIVEWQSPDFQTLTGRFSLLFLALALMLLVRFRLSWRDVVPTVAFLAAGLVALRNLPVAAIVVAPVLGRALRRPEDYAGRPAATAEPAPRPNLRLHRALLATIVAAFVVFGASVYRTPPLRLQSYPVRSVTYLEDQGLLGDPHRLAHQDFVGNYITLRFGRLARVFVDDRVDMYPSKVSEDYRALLGGKPDSLEVLDRRRVDVVLWDRQLALVTLLHASGEWTQVFRDDDWVVYRRQV